MEAQLEAAGFRPAGRYLPTRFEIDNDWQARRAVYAWIRREQGTATPVRVGIACGTGGMRARYTLYNRWLEGRFKPHDEREQLVRALKIEGLGSGAEVWAVEVPSKEEGRALEETLRRTWADHLDLDLMVRTSWVATEMKRRRPSRVSAPANPVQPRPERLRSVAARGDLDAKLSSVESWTRQEFAWLDAQLARVTTDVTDLSRGARSYSLGSGRKLARVDPKQDYIAVGFSNVVRPEVERLGVLRQGRADHA